ncbi:hypothetical protein [uncultured Hymenobacter sp.]|uniref:hypothetical protein n=1 Tax=uncultured Hymenobacter sp. TaxID=170016 RepID=UPI0035CC517D
MLGKSRLLPPLTLGLLAFNLDSASVHAQSLSKANERVLQPKFVETPLLRAAPWRLAHPKHRVTDWTNGAGFEIIKRK